MRVVKWRSITINWKTCSSTVLKQFDLLSNTLKKWKKVEMCSILSNFISTQNWKLDIAVIKTVAKKKKTIDLMPTKPKTLLLKMLNERRIRFGNKHNHVVLIIQKSVLLLNWSGSSFISWHCTICNPQLFIIYNKKNKTLNSWLFEVVTGYHIKHNLAGLVSAPLFALRLQYQPQETSETANICILMASFLL